MKPGERLAVIDLGSNSFRLVVFSAGASWWRRTDEIYEPVRIGEGLAASGRLGAAPLGTVRMSERFLPGAGPAKRGQLRRLGEHVHEELGQAGWLGGGGVAGARRLVGIGGTVRNLAAAAQRVAGLPSNGVGGMVIEAEVLSELIERLAALPAAKRASVPGIKPARADLILAGAVVVAGVLRAGGFSGLEATEAGMREGVFFERLLTGRDPPLFEDVRRASVLNLAAQYQVDPAHTRHVAALALGMFDELARLGLHPGAEREREPLWAASLLHDIRMSVD